MSNEENCNMQNMVATIGDDGITLRPRESHEDLNELKRQIWALDATVHNLRLKNEALQEAIVAKDDLISAQKDVVKELNLQLEAVGAGGVQSFGADSAAREQNHVHIQRFNNFAGIMNPEARGLYVRYEDYAAHIAALTATQQEVQEPHGWLYEWTHSSAIGKPDTTVTGFTRDEEHARKHHNFRAVYTTPQPAPSIGAEVRKQDEALIRQMLKALTSPINSFDALDLKIKAVAAARARLGEGGV